MSRIYRPTILCFADTPHLLTLRGKCSVSGEEWEMTVDKVKYFSWIEGQGKIQDLFSELTPDQREMLMTGITQKGWDMLFPKEEDDDDEQNS